MKYKAYYLAIANNIIAGPFSSIDVAVQNKQKVLAPLIPLTEIIVSTIEGEAL